MIARGAFLLLLLLPLAGSAASLIPATAGPILGRVAPAAPTPLQLQLVPRVPVVNPAFLPTFSTIPRVVSRAPNTGSKAWIDSRAETNLFTGSTEPTGSFTPPPEVPEPSTAALLALGLFGLAARRR